MAGAKAIATKACRICRLEKSLNDFFVDRGNKSGRRNDCKVCNSKSSYARVVKKRLANPGYKSRFGSVDGRLKPGELLLVAGLDVAWLYVVYRSVAGVPGYVVGTDGSLWSRRVGSRAGLKFAEWRRLTGRRDQDGYVHVKLSRGGRYRRFLLHQLILATFIGPRPPGMECRHLNGDPSDNRIINLRWGTPVENCADRERHGRTSKGIRRPNAKLNDDAVKKIRVLVAKGESQRSVARRFDLDIATVCRIVHRKSWAHVA